MRIYLTGFMASGKSTVGPRVAERLGLGFLDLDDLIEARAGRSIPEIFAEQGEAGFRRQEAEALRATARREDVVVALGGGALVEADNLAFARAHGTVVYLRVPVEELARRLEGQAAERPLMQDASGTPLSPAAMRARIDSMLAARRRFYEQAHVTVDAARPADEVAAAVARRVEKGMDEWRSG